MTRTENEQEFVLGNRQLLSAFFVVICLLGVFFVMGYIVGSNSKSEAAAKKSNSADAPPAATSSPSTDPPPSAMPDPAPAQTEPARPAAVAEERPAPKKEVEHEAAAARVESGRGHTYLQVSAVKRPAADSIVKTLKDKGFPALLGESSKPELFRVLVGPYATTEDLSKAKSDLKAMGFDAVVSK
jgi:cell division septation protein DedD